MTTTKHDYIYYKKEIMDSLKEGAIITSKTIGRYMILKYLFKMSPPSAKLDINDTDKLGLGIVGGVLVKDYAVEKKWINLQLGIGKHTQLSQ